jgi:hypothetical protein
VRRREVRRRIGRRGRENGSPRTSRPIMVE